MVWKFCEIWKSYENLFQMGQILWVLSHSVMYDSPFLF